MIIGYTVITTRRPMSCLLYVVVDLDAQRGGAPDGHGQQEHAEPDEHVPEGHRIVGEQVAEQRGGGGAHGVQQGGQLGGEHDGDGVRADQHRYDHGQHDDDGQQARADERELRQRWRRLCRVRVHVAGRRQLDSGGWRWARDDRTCRRINNVAGTVAQKTTSGRLDGGGDSGRSTAIALVEDRDGAAGRPVVIGRDFAAGGACARPFVAVGPFAHLSVLIVHFFQVAEGKAVSDLGQWLWDKNHKIVKNRGRKTAEN